MSIFIWIIIDPGKQKINFIGIFGTICTVIGYSITLYQLSKIRTEKEITETTKTKYQRSLFIRDSITKIEKYLEDLNSIRINISKSPNFTKEFLATNILILESIKLGLFSLKEDQKNSKFDKIFECEECLNCTDKLIVDLNEDKNSTDESELPQKQQYSSRLLSLNEKLIELKSLIISKHEA